MIAKALAVALVAVTGLVLVGPDRTSLQVDQTPALKRDTSPTQEPMQTQVRTVDSTAVLYQYGEPVPSFDTWRLDQPARSYLSLDGAWDFKFDPKNVGRQRGWYRPTGRGSGWRKEPVPGSWDLYETPGFGGYNGADYGKGSAFYDGYAWYRKSVSVPRDWQGRFVKLMFLGAGYKTWVYVNGHLVGEHEGGHTPFALDARYLKPGSKNVIAVRVYRRPSWTSYTSSHTTSVTSPTAVPKGPVDYWPYAGITRDVFLEATDEATISKILTTPGDHTLEADVVLYNHGSSAAQRVLVADPGTGTGAPAQSQTVDVLPGQTRVAKFSFEMPDAKWWSPSSPTLYRTTASLEALGGGDPLDELSTTYGMRTIATGGGHLLLNGSPVFLKGVSWHEETASNGASMTPADYRRTLDHVIDLRGNFIRDSHYNRHPYAYEYADQRGIMVLDEADNMWLKPYQESVQTKSYGLSRALVEAMVWNQEDHPSVIMWSMENESSAKNPTVYTKWLSDMRDAAKALDPEQRPVTWAWPARHPGDPSTDLPDVIGLNEYFGWRYGTDSDLGAMLDALHARHPTKPILITENGTSAWAGTGPASKPGTQEWRVREFRRQWGQVVARTSYMAGYTYWLLKDYKERMVYNRGLNGISTMGLMTFGERPRPIYFAFKDAPIPQV